MSNTIKLYGGPRTSASRVYWMLEELGLKYEVIPLDLSKREQKGDAYMKLNPNGKVPTLIDGDQVIWESMAINTYLAEKAKSPLAGTSAVEKGLIQQWSFWAMLELQKPAVDWLIQEMFVPADKKEPKVIEKSKETIGQVLPILDREFTSKQFLVGDRFTMADLNVASIVSICAALRFDMTPYKNINKWMSACSDRPAFQKLKTLREAAQRA